MQIVAGKPKVIPAVDGQVVARDKVVPAILSILPKPEGERKAAVGLSQSKAKLTTEAAQALGITEVMGQFTTKFPHADYRNVNIGTAARKINGTLLKPDETFSLNKIVGERTKENGFTEGNIINGGKFVLDLGGGVSQSATTTFNAAFFAGLKDVEHKAHSVYISRYPVGREATVAWPSVDLKFLNDSGHGILVQTLFTASTPGTQGSITVKIWGTKVWDITAGAVREVQPPRARAGLQHRGRLPAAGADGRVRHQDLPVLREERPAGEDRVLHHQLQRGRRHPLRPEARYDATGDPGHPAPRRQAVHGSDASTELVS